MSGLLSSPFDYDSNLVEGQVTNIDPKRFVCSVRTNKGQYLNQVVWLTPAGGSGRGGIQFAPHIGDQVVVSTALTYPLIIGCLPKLGLPTTDLSNATGTELGVDAGNNSDIKGDFSLNPDKPIDFVPGDMLLTSEGGSVVGALANGSAVIKASTFAQVFLSKFDDLVRVVARNWERFSDVGQQTVVNVKGRLYEYLGWDRSLSRSRNGIYELQDVIGDVAAGEVLLGEPNDATTLPVADTRVRKYWLKDASGNDLMVDILNQDGSIDITITNPTSGGTSNRHQDSGTHVSTATLGTFSKVTLTPTSAVVTYNNAAITTLDATGVKSTFGGHFCNVTSTGVQLG